MFTVYICSDDAHPGWAKTPVINDTVSRGGTPKNLFKLFGVNNFNKHAAVASNALDDSFHKIQ